MDTKMPVKWESHRISCFVRLNPAPVFFYSEIFGGAIRSKKGSLATILGLFQGRRGWWIITCAKFGRSPTNMFAQTAKTQTCFSSLKLFFLDACNVTKRVVAKRSYQFQLVDQTFWSIDRAPLQRWVPCIILLHHIHDLVVLSVSLGKSWVRYTSLQDKNYTHTHIWHCCFASLALKTWVFFFKGFGRRPGNFRSFRVSTFAISQVKSIVARSDEPPSLGSAPPAEYNGCSHPVLWLNPGCEATTFHRWQVVGSPDPSSNHSSCSCSVEQKAVYAALIYFSLSSLKAFLGLLHVVGSDVS